MKKFSNITGEKIGQEPKIEIKINEEDIFKSKVLRLMDDFLKVQMYGPITRYHVAGTMKVSGKELFLEALMDLLNNKSKIDSKKLLESLKTEIKDWQSIDNKIDEIKSDKSVYTYRKKIKNLYNKYKNDTNLLLEKVDESLNKIKDKDSLTSRIYACESIMKDSKFDSVIISKILKKYSDKLNEFI
jgi:hypothetical protein